MRRLVVWVTAAALGGCAGLAFADQGGKGLPLWDFYSATLSHAKYIDLTHALAPGRIRCDDSVRLVEEVE